MLHGKGEIARHFREQPHLIGSEGVGFGGEEDKDSDHFTFDFQGQETIGSIGHGVAVKGHWIFVSATDNRHALFIDLLDGSADLFADRVDGGGPAGRIAAGKMAPGIGNGLGIAGADPGDRIAALIDGDPARFLEQFLAVLQPDNGRVDTAEDEIEPGQVGGVSLALAQSPGPLLHPLLERRVGLLQLMDSIVEPAVHHLKRRHHLRQKFLAPAQIGPHPFDGRAAE
ncbi:MAG: hypothetical protein ACD_75C02521G0002 [uncultured bacterium]|nr:MAG: hypothetical protein ACD_75C02521G0002 [uncultured bacterium]